MLNQSRAIKSTCYAQHRVLFEKGHPSKFGFLIVMLLGFYITIYTPGMGTEPWFRNSKLYPLRYGGTIGEIDIVLDWISNFIVGLQFEIE